MCESQALYKFYRERALIYILEHSEDFKKDIELMNENTVQSYVKFMTPDYIFGDHIILISLCLYLDVSIRVFQKTRDAIDYCIFRPSHGRERKEIEIYLDLGSSHYECIITTVKQQNVLYSK